MKKKNKKFVRNRNFRFDDIFMAIMKRAAKIKETTVTDIVKKGSFEYANNIIKSNSIDKSLNIVSVPPVKVNPIVEKEVIENKIPEKIEKEVIKNIEPEDPSVLKTPDEIERFVDGRSEDPPVGKRHDLECTECGAVDVENSEKSECMVECFLCGKVTLHKSVRSYI